MNLFANVTTDNRDPAKVRVRLAYLYPDLEAALEAQDRSSVQSTVMEFVTSDRYLEALACLSKALGWARVDLAQRGPGPANEFQNRVDLLQSTLEKLKDP